MKGPSPLHRVTVSGVRACDLRFPSQGSFLGMLGIKTNSFLPDSKLAGGDPEKWKQASCNHEKKHI